VADPRENPSDAGRFARPADVERIATLLRRAGLRPHGARRIAVLYRLAEHLDGAPQPVRELTATLAHRADVSRAAARDVLAAVQRGAGLLDAQGDARRC
jgi:hypothetical protein